MVLVALATSIAGRCDGISTVILPTLNFVGISLYSSHPLGNIHDLRKFKICLRQEVRLYGLVKQSTDKWVSHFIIQETSRNFTVYQHLLKTCYKVCDRFIGALVLLSMLFAVKNNSTLLYM